MNKPESDMPIRPNTLTKDYVILAAIKLADANGIEWLSMRKLGRELGVEAMALYYHFANKNQLIEKMVDHIHGEIAQPLDALNWRSYMKQRAMSALDLVVRHPWASSLMETGVNPGPATLTDSDNMIKCFRQAGFSIAMTVHAVTVLNIYIYGAAQQYARLPFTDAQQASDVSSDIQQQFSVNSYPYLGEMISQHMMKSAYSAIDEFNFGLNMILDGIERMEVSN